MNRSDLKIKLAIGASGLVSLIAAAEKNKVAAVFAATAMAIFAIVDILHMRKCEE